MRPAQYRVEQFFRYWWSRPLSAAERAEVAALLGPRLAALFDRMAPGEQAHSLQVLRRVQAGGGDLPVGLLQAALLHDVGKTLAPMSLAGRVAVVLAGKFLADLSQRWGQGAPAGWRRPFVTAAQHAAWGAALCAAAGAEPLVVALVRRHQDKLSAAPAALEDAWLRRLQAADDET